MKNTIISGVLSLFIFTCLAVFNPGYGYAGSAAIARGKPAVKSTLQDILTSAKEGDAEAQVKLGFMYHRGRGIPRDYHKAFVWYEKAAAQGNAEANFRIGQLYYKGQGLIMDHREAFKRFEKAAMQGYAKAQFNLGIMYANGDTVPRDYVLSYMWFNLSGAGGFSPARARLDKLEAKMPPEQLKIAQKMSMDFTKR